MPSSGMIASLMRHGPEFAVEIVGRILRPDALDHADRFHRLALAHLAIGIAEQLEIGKQPADADAEHEAAAAHVVELRDFGGDLHRVMVRQADHRGAEGQILGARNRLAMNISGEGIGSVVAEKCSPSHNSSKPSASA